MNDTPTITQHTPGPWTVGSPLGYNANHVYAGDSGIAQVYGIAINHSVEELSERDAQGLANARLMASSPSLLLVAIWHRDALDLGDVAFYERHGFNVSEIMPRTRSVIAAATEESK